MSPDDMRRIIDEGGDATDVAARQMALALEVARPFLPQPATRLERIVIALLPKANETSLDFEPTRTAESIVKAAAAIDDAISRVERERELTRTAGGAKQ
jgi:hypothetical protein